MSGLPIRCALGTLAKGARVTITVTAKATTAGRQVNTAVAMSASWDPAPHNNAMSASWDPAPHNNLAQADTTIRPAPAPAPPPFTG